MYFCTFTHRDGGSGKGQAEQHQQRDDLMVWIDVRQAQASVVAVKAGLHRLEDVRPLQEVEADHRRDQDRQLSTGRPREKKKKYEGPSCKLLIKHERKEFLNE